MSPDEAQPVLVGDPPPPCPDRRCWMLRDPTGLRCWVCMICRRRQPFNIDGDQ